MEYNNSRNNDSGMGYCTGLRYLESRVGFHNLRMEDYASGLGYNVSEMRNYNSVMGYNNSRMGNNY